LVTDGERARLRECRFVIGVWTSTAMHLATAGRHIPKLEPVQFLGEPDHWVDTGRYLALTVDKWLACSIHIDVQN
jgi:hypothetical protein